MSKEPYFDAIFVDSEAREWRVVLSTKIVMKFCKEENLGLHQLSPEQLNLFQQMKLCYLGIKHYSPLKQLSFEEFEETMIEGAALTKAIEAVSLAIANFSLPQLPKEADRLKVVAEIKKGLAAEQEDQPSDSDE